jgi:hypothetical protein
MNVSGHPRSFHIQDSPDMTPANIIAILDKLHDNKSEIKPTRQLHITKKKKKKRERKKGKSS